MIFWKLLWWKDNFYFIARTTTEIYNILSEMNKENNFHTEKELYFLSWAADALIYIERWEIEIQEIYDIAVRSRDFNDFLFNFIRRLLIADMWINVVLSWMDNNRWFCQEKIQMWINDAKNNNSRLHQAVLITLNDSRIEEIIKSNR